MAHLFARLVSSVRSRTVAWRRQRNLRAGVRTGRVPVQLARVHRYGFSSVPVRARTVYWAVAACVLAVLGGGALIAGHARHLASVVAARSGDAGGGRLDALQPLLPGAVFDVPETPAFTVVRQGEGAVIVAGGAAVSTPVRINLCEQVSDPARGRIVPVRVGYRFDALARLSAQAGGQPGNVRNALVVADDAPWTPTINITGTADMTRPLTVLWAEAQRLPDDAQVPRGSSATELPQTASQPLAAAAEQPARGQARAKLQWVSDRAGAENAGGGTGELDREAWLVWNAGAIHLQRRAAAGCPRGGELLVSVLRLGSAQKADALVTALAPGKVPVSLTLKPGHYEVPLAARPGLEDQSLFDQLRERGLLRLGANGLIELVPRDLPAWRSVGAAERAAELQSWSGVQLDAAALKLMKRLYRMADGDYVRQQAAIFNAERRLLAVRVRLSDARAHGVAAATHTAATPMTTLATTMARATPGGGMIDASAAPDAAMFDWSAESGGAAAATSETMPAAASALFASLPQGWSSWTRVAQWPDADGAPQARLTLALNLAPADTAAANTIPTRRADAHLADVTHRADAARLAYLIRPAAGARDVDVARTVDVARVADVAHRADAARDADVTRRADGGTHTDAASRAGAGIDAGAAHSTVAVESTRPIGARAGTPIELMLTGRLVAVQGARIAEQRDACTGRACPDRGAVRIYTLVPSPGATAITLDATPLAMADLANPGDERYRHIRIVSGRPEWQALDDATPAPRAAATTSTAASTIAITDRNGTPLWTAGAPTAEAQSAGLAPLLGIRADHANSVAGMLARAATETNAPGQSHAARLTIDLPLQQLAQNVLDCVGMRRGHWTGDACTASRASEPPPNRHAGVVILDADTGDILAAAGAGMGDPAASPWPELRDFDAANPASSPLRVPAWQHDGGVHNSPGSTFKVVSALGLELAAKRDPQLEHLLTGMPLADINRVAQQRGYAFRTDAATYPLATTRAHVTNYRDGLLDRRAQEGRFGLAQALTYSLNTWFAWSGELSDRTLLGHPEGGLPDVEPLEPGALDTARPILAMAHLVGFERPIRLDGGLLPRDFAWRRWDALQASPARIDPVNARHELRQMAIGLRMQTTPLHMAMAAGAVGEGRVLAPRLLLNLDGRAAQQPDTPALAVRLDRIRAGMKGVIDTGTAAGAFRAPGLAEVRRHLYGKTGTAPTIAVAADGSKRDVATVWFTGWLEPGALPGQTHRLAVAAYASHSDATGGEHAAPVIAAIFETLVQNGEKRGK